MQHVSCGSLRFTPELTAIIMNHYETMIGHENSGLHIDSIIVNKITEQVYVELRAGGRHGVFWDFCEVFLNDGVSLIKKKNIDKFSEEYTCVMFRANLGDVYLQDGKKAFESPLKLLTH